MLMVNVIQNTTQSSQNNLQNFHFFNSKELQHIRHNILAYRSMKSLCFLTTIDESPWIDDSMKQVCTRSLTISQTAIVLRQTLFFITKKMYYGDQNIAIVSCDTLVIQLVNQKYLAESQSVEINKNKIFDSRERP